MTKVKKFKPKRRKGAVKRLKLTGASDKTVAKLTTKRTNHAHRLINKSGERKLKAARETTVSKAHDKYKKVI